MRRATLSEEPEREDARLRVAAWLALTSAAGCVNAIALAASTRFVTHMTGIVTRVGVNALRPILLAEYVLVLVSFVAGAACAVALARRSGSRRWVPLVVAGALVAAVGGLGSLGVLGRFGGGVEEVGDFVFLGLLALAMGVQNASVLTAAGKVVRTTHVTGIATELGIALGTWLHPLPDDNRRDARRAALLRAGKIVSFALGASLGVALAPELGFGALWIPASVTVLIGLAGSALPVRSASARPPAGSSAPASRPRRAPGPGWAREPRRTSRRRSLRRSRARSRRARCRGRPCRT